MTTNDSTVAAVVDLASRRQERHPDDPDAMTCPACGDHWFELDGRAAGLDRDAGAVALRADGSVRAYVGHLRCVECGHRLPLV